MIKQVKHYTIQLMAGANIATVVMMLLVGYSDRLNPATHPLLSTLGMAFPFFVVANLLFLFFWLTFKWTKVWIPIVGFFLAYIPIHIYMPFHIPQELPDSTFKLVSYNVCGYGGNFKYENGFETVRDYLRDEQADIVCLQEDNDTWRRNVFKEYEKIFAYNDTAVLCKSELSFNALGIHTRFPIVRRERIDYHSVVNNGSVAWWLKVGKDTLIVINNHFEGCHLNQTDREQYRQMLKGELVRDSVRKESKLLMVKLAEANAKRSVQIDRVCEYVRAHAGYPIIVCGDFNDNPLSYSCHAMSQMLKDCYVETGRGIGLSFNQKAFLFRIDHVFCSENIQPFNCKVDSKMDASDHYPISCRLKIMPKD